MRSRALCGWSATLLLGVAGSLLRLNGVTLAWDPLPEAWVAGYAIRYGGSSGNYTGRVDVGTATSATLTNLTPGATYYFVAHAYTADGQENPPSNEIAYTIPASRSPCPGGEPLCVNAGADQIVLLSSPVLLVGRVSNAGQPFEPGKLTIEWSLVSGPGEAAFETRGSPSTRVSFSTPGMYQLRLSAAADELSAFDELTVTVAPDTPQYPAGLVIEAESGRLSEPMRSMTHFNGEDEFALTPCIASLATGKGTARFEIEAPEAGAYWLWARVLALGDLTDAFYISADGAANHVLRYDSAAEGINTWRWVCLREARAVNRTATASFTAATPCPQAFLFAAGAHEITITGAQVGGLLDKFILTNDRNYVPSEEAIAPETPGIVGLEFVATGLRIKWHATPGAVYRLVYKDSLGDSLWLPASPDLVAVDQTLSWLDPTVDGTSRRFYCVQAVTPRGQRP